MAISKITSSGLAGDKYNVMTAGNNYYEPLATVTLTSTATTLTFSNIPQTYKDLQIRMSYQTVSLADNLGMTLNGSINSSYWHYMKGNGAAQSANGIVGSSGNFLSNQDGVSTTAYYAGILDILDYANTNKYKTSRFFNGIDLNGSGGIILGSNHYSTTAAITSITLYTLAAQSLAIYSKFALYGLKG